MRPSSQHQVGDPVDPAVRPAASAPTASSDAATGADLAFDARVQLPPSRLAVRRARRPAAWEQPGILTALLVTALLLPLLLVVHGQTGTRRGGTTQVVRTATTAGAESPSSTIAERRAAVAVSARVVPIAVSVHTSDELTPTRGTAGTVAAGSWIDTAPVTTVAAPTPTTAWSPPPTALPTTAPPATAPPTTAAASSGHSESGLASYYAHNPGGCASRTLPKGTVVTISGNGHTASCVVDDYGPFGAGRIIDLSEEVFGQLADLSTGVIPVTVTW